jgi:translocation and assembly module TamB
MATGSEPPGEGAVARRARRGRRLRVVAIMVLVLGLGLFGLGRWLGSEVVLHWAAERAELASGGRLSLERAEGSLLGTVRVGRVRWHDGPLTFSVDDASVSLGWRGLLQGRLHVRVISARHVEVVSEPAPEAPPARMPIALRLPVPLEVGEVRIDELVVREAGTDPPLRLSGLSAGLRYDRARWFLESARLAGPFGVLQAGATLGDTAPFPLDGRLLLETHALGDPITVDAVLGGDLAATTVEARTVLRDASLAGRLRLAPFGPVPLAGLRLSLGGLDLARFGAGLPATRIDGSLEAEAPPDASPAPASGAAPRLPPLAGALRLRNAAVGPIDAGSLPLEEVATRFALLAGRLRLDGLELAGPAGRLTGDASVDVPAVVPTLAALPAFGLRLVTESLDLKRIHGALRATVLRGSLRLAPESGGLGFDARLADGERSLEARARLAAGVVEIAQARLQARDGVALLRGRAGIVAPFSFELAGSVSALDPSRFAEVPAGSLNGAWEARGRLEPGLSVNGSLRLADSRWRGLPLSGSVAARYEPDRLQQVDASLRLGGTALTARGALGATGDRLAVELDAARLAEIDPRLGGRMGLRGELRGALRDPGLTASATARDLALDAGASASAGPQVRVRGLTAGVELGRLGDLLALLARAGVIEAASAGAAGPLAATLRADGLRIDEVAVDVLHAAFDGDAGGHVLSASAAASKPLRLDGAVRVEGGFAPGAPGRWTGRLTELANDASPTVRLLEPASIALSPDAVAVSSLRLRIDGDDGALLSLDDAAWSPSRVALQGTLSGVPMRWLEALGVAADLRLRDEGALRLGARFDVSGRPGPGGGLAGRIEAFRESGDLIVDLPAADGGTERIAAGLQTLRAVLDIADERVRATLDVRGTALGTIGGDAQAPLAWASDGMTPTLDVPLDGRLVLDVPSLAFTRALSGEAWRFDGSLQARLTLAGTVAVPRISGRFTGSGLVAEQREYGMKLTDGTLAADLRENLVEIETLRFSSGKGSVSMSGSLRPDERSEAVLVLDRLPIPLGAGQRLLLSGEARASLSRGILRLRGALRADEGLIELTAQNMPRVARDVVVVSDTAEAARRWKEGIARRDAARARAAERANGIARGDGGAPPGDATPAQAAAAAADAEAEQRRGFQVRSNLEIDLGDALRVFGAGVDARLAGKLTLRGSLPDAARLTGTVRVVQGTYTGFGQKLEIERGTLVFSGPVDNPAIDIAAYRRYLPVEAGVALTGTARTPRIALVSKPDVPEPDKLSWLVLGVGSDTARSGGESAALQTAAATLLAAADPNASGPGFASTFGLDVLSIRTSQVGSSGDTGSTAASAQDSIVTLGKRMTERLFVSYEQSLRGLQNLLRLQYEITERLQVRTRVGSQNAVDLLWTYRYD